VRRVETVVAAGVIAGIVASATLLIARSWYRTEIATDVIERIQQGGTDFPAYVSKDSIRIREVLRRRLRGRYDIEAVDSSHLFGPSDIYLRFENGERAIVSVWQGWFEPSLVEVTAVDTVETTRQ
jgi:hypothetical protein